MALGFWKDDKCHGDGEHLWGEGGGPPRSNRVRCNLYRGEWAYGLRTGKGSFFYADGSLYTGHWANNMKEGEGTFKHTSGKISRGFFTKDRSTEVVGTRATENVDVQIILNIQDCLLSHPKPFSEIKDGTTPQTPPALKSSLEKLLLRFNSQIKLLYRRYVEIANRRRAKEIGIFFLVYLDYKLSVSLKFDMLSIFFQWRRFLAR